MENKKTVVREVERKTSPKGRPENRPETSDNKDNLSIPVIEEHLNIDKKTVETGKYQIKKTVSREDFSQDIPTIHEKVDIQRVQVNKYIDSPPQIRYEGDTTIIPVIKEVVVVEKKLMLVEEIHVTKTNREVSVNVKDQIQREDVEINKIERM